jgi:hypothetical protein
MSSQIDLLNKLKNNLLIFIDELISILPSESDLVLVRFFIKDHVPIADVMTYISNKLLPLDNYVRAKDDRFFLEHQVLFEELRDEQNRVNYFKNVWTNLDEDNKEVIWNWFALFLNIAKKYNSLSS